MKNWKNLVPGDHIKVQRIGYTHHGIYIGNAQVIHYTGEVFQKIFNVSQPTIRQDHVSTFSDGNRIDLVQYFNTFPPERIISRAYSRLGEAKYGIFSNNCEHFATWCVTGEHKSEQVEDATKAIVPSATVATVATTSVPTYTLAAGALAPLAVGALAPLAVGALAPLAAVATAGALAPLALTAVGTYKAVKWLTSDK